MLHNETRRPLMKSPTVMAFPVLCKSVFINGQHHVKPEWEQSQRSGPVCKPSGSVFNPLPSDWPLK